MSTSEIPGGKAAEPAHDGGGAGAGGGSAPQHGAGAAATPPVTPKPKAGGRRLAWGIGPVVVLLAMGAAWPSILNAINTVSTDDAYVNDHVTFVAPRVAGQVARVLVDDNNRVHKGDVLVQLDREPFEVQLHIAQAEVAAAQADLVTTQAQAMGLAAQARSLRWALEHAMEDVDNQVALIHSRVATVASEQANLDNAKRDYEKEKELYAANSSTPKELYDYRDAYLVAQARLEKSLQEVYQIRVNLGLPPKPVQGDDLTQVPADINQTASMVRQAQASLIQAAVQLGVVVPFSKTPRQMLADFYKRDPEGNIDRIYAKLIPNSPGVLQAKAKLAEAQRQLDQAKLNLSYCDVVAEIDGVVTSRNVNPGNNVVVGQSLMAVRSLTEVWIDANFKETQLDELRIGQAVDIEADMYGRHTHFLGRITGFTNGTGSTLALLPAENATGNFVKVVQRLPVRIDLVDYDPDKTPLFVGLSVTPYVRVKEPATGANAGMFLQPHFATNAEDAGSSGATGADIPGVTGAAGVTPATQPASAAVPGAETRP